MWLLVPVAFAPDWIQWLLETTGHRNPEYSHSLISVGVGATTVALVYWLATRQRGDALTLWLLYLSHWAADFITGVKPTWPHGPMVGLGLYTHPTWDFVLESLVIAGCWLVYRRSFEARVRRGALMLLVPLGLVAMQAGFEVLQNPAVRAIARELP